MKKRARIDFACNDPDNGIFDARCRGINLTVGGCLIELEPEDLLKGYRFRVEDGLIKMHRRRFAYCASKDWVGNWCWNRYALSRHEAKRLLFALRASGLWRCVAGPVRWYDWFNRAVVS